MKICKSKVKEIIGLVFLFAGLVLMFSCCDMFGIEEETESKYDITFINNSSYGLNISDPYGDDFEEFSIAVGETKIIESIDDYVIFDITADTENVLIDYDRSDKTITLYDGYYSYLHASDYDSLISSLSSSSNIDRDMIDSFLEELRVKQNYDYSYYSSGNYICHTLNWSSYSSYSYGWIYYVSVDIWVDNAGNLRETMCSYYSD